MKIGGGEDVRFVRGFEVLNSLDEVVHLGLHQTSGQPLLTVPGLPGMPGGPSGAISLHQSEDSVETGWAVVGRLVHRWKAGQEQEEDQSMEGEG